MINSRVLQLLFLASSMTPQVVGMLPVERVASNTRFQVEGIAQRIEELPKELRYKILSSALALRENQKYELYKKFNVGSQFRWIALNPDNTRMLTGSFNGIACIWDVKEGKLLQELKGHTKMISSGAISANGTLALTASWDRTARIWNMNTGELIKTLEIGSPVYSVALSADGTLALIGTENNSGSLYNTSTGELLKVLQESPGSACVVSVALSANGALAFTGDSEGKARVWNALTGELLDVLRGETSCSASVALSADGAIALTEVGNSKIFVWNTKTGTLLNTLLPNSRYIYSIVVNKDGKRALTGTGDNKIQLWNTKPLPGQKETSTPLTVLEGHTEPVTALAFGGDDFIASAGSNDGTVIIWKPYALEPRAPQENVEVLWQAYKETFSKPTFLFPDKK